MFIDRLTTPGPTPFGGAEFNWDFTTQNHSAPPNGAGGDLVPRAINMSPQTGVKLFKKKVSGGALKRKMKS
jgi:hypothetical protein